jgi:Cytidylyltransferase
MLADAIEKAKATGLFDVIAVSSDDSKCLQIAHDYGVLPLWRTPGASSDTATDDDVAREVVGYFDHVATVCKLYPCVPLLDYNDILQAHSWLWSKFGRYRGLYSVDESGKDAGAFYLYDPGTFRSLDTIALDRFPWGKYFLKVCKDINTIEDYNEAVRMANAN